LYRSAASIANDLTFGAPGEKPLWPLSSYGPFKLEPTLIGGLDVSSEELRFKAFTAQKAGNVQEYVCGNNEYFMRTLY